MKTIAEFKQAQKVLDELYDKHSKGDEVDDAVRRHCINLMSHYENQIYSIARSMAEEIVTKHLKENDIS
jgi:hypothetical protein